MTHQKSSMWRCSLTQISAEMTKIVIQPVAAGYNYLDSRRGFHLHGCLRSKALLQDRPQRTRQWRFRTFCTKRGFLLELWKELLQRDVRLRVREDNKATAKIDLAGYSKRLRHLRRTQKIHLASPSGQLNQTDIELMLVNTLFQKADVFTKAIAGPLWENAVKLLSNILKDYKILHTSSTGLKMNFENLEEALGPSYGEVRPEPKSVPKAAAKKRYKKKAQRILPYDICESTRSLR